MTECLGDKLPDRWWRSREKCPCGEDHLIVEHEEEAHGSSAASAHAHGVIPNTVAQGRQSLGARKLRPGGKATIGHASERAGEEVSREEILESDLKEARRRLVQIRETEIAAEKLVELVEQKIGEKRPRYKPAARERGKSKATHRFALQWSDIHASEIVNPEEVNGLNEFNWDVMLKRHDTIRQSVLSFRENRPYHVDKLHVWALGDMLTGDIHDELRVTNELVLTEATIQLGLDMAEWLEGFVPEFQQIQIDCVFGNHGRRSQKPQFKQAFDNWDWLFYKILETRMRGYPSVKVNVSKAAMQPVMVYEKRVLLWHGDGVRTTMPGVPWGGIIRRTKEIAETYAKMGLPIDHFALGHWHEAQVVANARILVNGSVKGPDEYSLARFGGGAPAVQSLFTFHPKRGLTDYSRLDLA